MTQSNLKKKLFHPKTDRFQLFAQLKALNGLDELEKRLAEASAHPITKKLLISNALPKKIIDIRKSRPIPHSGKLEGEFGWILQSIKQYSSELNKYIKLKEAYEAHLATNNYETAEHVLSSIDRNVCVSIWGLEQQFLIAELSGGVEKNWAKLSELSQLVNDPFILFLIENFSKRSEANISYLRYRDIFVNQISELEGHQGFVEYLCFRLNYPSYVGFKSYSLFLNIESTSSIIDRYNMALDVLSELVGSSNVENIKIAHEVCIRLKSYGILDTRLEQLINILSPGQLNVFDPSIEILNVLDAYAKGEYSECLKIIPDLIAKYPSIIELLDVYTKSLIELKKAYKEIGFSNCTDEIARHLYNMYSRNEHNSSSTEFLLKTSLTYYTCSWAKQIFSLVSAYTNMSTDDEQHTILLITNSKFNNPYLFVILRNLKLERHLIIELHQDFFDSKSIELSYWISEGQWRLILADPKISPSKKQLYVGRSMLQLEPTNELISHFEKILENRSISPLTYEESTIHLFNQYVQSKKYKDAILLYVNTYFKNRHYVIRLENKTLLNTLINELNSISISDNIETSIFFHLANADSYDTYVAYDMYLEQRGVERPSQLIANSKLGKDKKDKYFLREICIEEIMHHSMHFSSSDEIENERIKVLQHLLLIDSENESNYIKEITEITQSTNVKQAIREVNKGRITVNVQRLKSLETAKTAEGFARYKELINYSRHKDWIALDGTSKMIRDYVKSLNDESLRSKVVHRGDPAFITFKLMFLEIRDKYLLSKEYGLDGYLSTRIRHGTLLNYIRSVFESLNLMSQKNISGEYQDNNYWDDKIPYSLHTNRNDIQRAMKAFSKKVDDRTESIIRDLIQVKTEKSNEHPNGLFDYSLQEEQLAHLFKVSRDTITDYESFLDFVFEFLEAKTEILLRNIRDYFNTTIKSDYESIIMDFHSAIRKIIGENTFADLNSSIVKCRTNIQTEIENISEWFNLSNPSSDLILDIDTLIKTGIEITNTIYPNNQITPTIEVETDLKLRGDLHLLYIIRILLDNIITHSGLPGEELHVKIVAKLINDSILRLAFTNNIAAHKQISDVEAKLLEAKQNWKKSQGEFEKINIEGGSGFDKIRRILTVDMACRNHELDFEIGKDGNVTVSIDLSVKVQPYGHE